MLQNFGANVKKYENGDRTQNADAVVKSLIRNQSKT